MTTILVTGATGTIGSELVAQLAAAGDVDVRAGVRDPSSAKAQALAGPRVSLVHVDLEDAARSAEAFRGADRVFVLTPFVEDATPLVRTAVALAREGGAKFLVRLSAAGADPGAPAHLARNHAAGEALVRGSGLPFALLRPTFFMDNLVSFAGDGVRRGTWYGAAGDGKVAYVSSRDVAAVAAAVLRDPARFDGATLEITGPEAHGEAEIATRLTALLGRPVAYVSLAPEAYEAALREAGLPAFAVEGLVFLEGVKAAGWAAHTTTAVRDATGQEGERLDAFLARHRAAFG